MVGLRSRSATPYNSVCRHELGLPLIHPGHDDAFAILLAAYHPALQILGISTVHGNASLAKTTNNALSVLQAIGRPDIAVRPGAAKPFCRQVQHAADIHGESGLDGTDLLPKPERLPLKHGSTIKDMRDSLMLCPTGTAWLVTSGTLTNAALLFATFPEVVEHIKGLSIMGGAIGSNFSSAPLGHDFKDASGETRPRIGNWTPYAEFNIWCDPEAAQSIFSNSELAQKTTLVPLDITHQAFADKQVQDMLLHARNEHETPTRLRQMFHELLMFFAHTYSDVFGLTEGPPLHDPLAVAVLLAEHDMSEHRIMFEDYGGERWDVEVILEGEQLGRTKIEPATKHNGVRIPRSLDVRQFWHVLEQCMVEADKATDHVR